MSALVLVLAIVVHLLKKLRSEFCHLCREGRLPRSGLMFREKTIATDRGSFVGPMMDLRQIRRMVWNEKQTWMLNKPNWLGTTQDDTSHVMRRSVRRPESPHPGNPTDIITWHSKLRACGPGTLRLQPSYTYSVVMLLLVSNYTSAAVSVVSPRWWVKERALYYGCR